MHPTGRSFVREERLIRQAKWGISALIVFTVAFHIVPIIQELKGSRQTTWPFMAWGMYRHSFPSDRPVRSNLKTIIAITSSGDEFPVSSEDIGLKSQAYGRFYTDPLGRGDRAAAQDLAERLNANRRDKVVALRLEIEVRTVRDGAVIRENERPAIYYVKP